MSNSKERKVLGKGLSALLRPMEKPVERDENDSQEKGARPFAKNEIAEVLIEKILVNEKQPRANFDEEKLDELSQSIKIRGILLPLLVREKGEGTYELIAGERRLRAAKLSGLEKVPVLIKKVSDSDMLELALIENIQRADLTPLEEGMAYEALLKEHGYTQEDLAKRVGKNRSTIANMIRLLHLPLEIQGDVTSSKLSMGHARALLSLENEEAQVQLRDEILAKNYTVRDTEKAVREKLEASGKREKPKTIAAKKSHSPQMQLNQERLSEHFATKVMVQGSNSKGKIEIEYYSQDDFNRIFGLLFRQ